MGIFITNNFLKELMRFSSFKFKPAIMIEKMTHKESAKILTDHYVGHLAYLHGETPYIVPITYYYDPIENAIFSYSGEGHKIKAMRTNQSVAFQTETIESLNNWMSVLVHGTFEELNGSAAKMYLHKLAQHVKNLTAKQKGVDIQSIDSFSSKMDSGAIPIVYRINIQDIIGRQR